MILPPESLSCESGRTPLLKLLHGSYLYHHGLSRGTLQQFEISIRSLERWAGRTLFADELTRLLIVGWINWLVANRAPSTAASKRKDILALWRWACQEGFCQEEPRRIRSVAIPRRDPVAWTRPELRRLLAACLLLKGKLRNGVSRAGCMLALAWVLYSTGLRLSACLALKREDLHQDGSIVAHWYSQKTLYSQTVNLRPEAIEACLRLGRHDRLVPWCQGKRSLWRWWKRVLEAANLPVTRRTGPQQMRRTAATWLEVEHPGAATAFLGHRTGDLARRNYLDPRIIHAARRLPPRL